MKNDQKWIQDGGVFYPISGNVILHQTPGPGIWTVYQSPDPMDPRLGLTKLDDKFEFDFKIYELGHEEILQKIMTLWNAEQFITTNKNLGVIFNGTKGTGKTIAAKLMCNKIELPTIIVNKSYGGAILDFINALNFECIILIDEAEKSFNKEGDNETLLKLIDGVYNCKRKLYILTTNKLSVDENLLGRPGRIRYIQQFKDLPIKAVSDYIDDNLIYKDKKSKIMQVVDLLEISTIDILKSIVEEVNIFGDIEDSTPLNIPKAHYSYDVVKFIGCTREDIPLIKKLIKATKDSAESIFDWYHKTLDASKISDDILNEVDKDDFIDGLIEVSVNKQEQAKSKEPVIATAEVIRGIMSDKSARGGKEEDENGAEEVINHISIQHLIRSFIKNCRYSDTYKMTSQYNMFWRDSVTSFGTIVEPLDDLGIFVVRDNWDGEEIVCLMLKQKTNPSLYHGTLNMLL